MFRTNSFFGSFFLFVRTKIKKDQNRKTILKIVKKFNKKDINALLIDKNKGYYGKLNKNQLNELKNDLRNNLFSTAKEVCKHVKSKYKIEYKPESMVKLLHKSGFTYKKTKHTRSRAEIEKQKEFIKEYEKLKENLPKNSKIYFMDAVHPQYNSIPAYAWIEKGKDIINNKRR